MSDSKSLPSLPQAQQGAARRYSEKNGSGMLSRILSRKQELSRRQSAAIPLLLRGLSDVEVGQQLGVDRGTVLRWRKETKFAAELAAQRRIVLQQSVARVQSLLDPALKIIEKQITGDDPKTALRAASILLRIATPARMQRMADDPSDSPTKGQREHDPFMEAVDAYINAPMPNEPGHPAYERDEDQDDDEET